MSSARHTAVRSALHTTARPRYARQPAAPRCLLSGGCGPARRGVVPDADGRAIALGPWMLTALKGSLFVVCLLAARGALAGEAVETGTQAQKGMPADAPLRNEPSEPSPAPSIPFTAMTALQLRQEIIRVDHSRPSGLLYIPAGVLAGGGLLSVLAAGIVNIDIRSCPSSTGGSYSLSFGLNINCRGPTHQTNPLTGALLGIGVPALVLGVAGLVIVIVVRRHLGRRLDLLERALSQLEVTSPDAPAPTGELPVLIVTPPAAEASPL